MFGRPERNPYAPSGQFYEQGMKLAKEGGELQKKRDDQLSRVENKLDQLLSLLNGGHPND